MTGWLGVALVVLVAAAPRVAAQEPQGAAPTEGSEEAAPEGAGTSGQQGGADDQEGDGAAGQGEEAEEDGGEGISFRFPFPQERGGGTVTGTAGSLDYEREQYVVLADGVELLYQDISVDAERIELDIPTKTLVASGDVVLDQGPRRLAGETLEFDLESKTGSLTDASAYVTSSYFFEGEEIAKVGEDSYTVRQGSFTSCEQEVPAWSFKLGRARVDVGGYARVRNASLRVKKVPVLFTPYILWPAKRERTSGFLMPQPGWSDRRGASISLAYYQTMGRSYDTTIELDAYSEGFVGLGNEFRYRPSENTEGELVAYGISDPDAAPAEDDIRWKVDWNHETRNLPGGLRGVIDFQDFSDFEFFRDFERDFDRTSLRFLDSRGYLSGNWGPHSLNVLVNERETFISPQRTVSLSKLPEIEYRLRPTKLGPTPLYLQLDSSLDYLSLERSETFQGEYFRGDLFPRFTLPVRAFPWLAVSMTAGQRLTFYGDRLRTQEERAELPPGERGPFAGEELSRTVPSASAEVVGPSLSRIFEKEAGGFAKFKHVVEPRWTYSFRDEFDEQDQVPLFDEVDTLRSTNLGRFSLINRLLAKPPEEEGGSAREILSLELSQAFSFEEAEPLQRGTVTEVIDGEEEVRAVERTAGPIVGLLRFNPRDGVSLKAQARYSTLFDGLESTQLSGDYRFGRNYMGLSWFTRRLADRDETVGNQVRLYGGFNVLERLRVESQINYDIEEGTLQQQRWIFNYAGSCYTFRFEVRDFQAGELRDTDFRFAVTLKNVGTFLDLTGGVSNRPRR